MHHDLVDVLIIEDESELARLHAELVQKHPRLRLAGMAASLAQARQLLHATPPQLVLLDNYLPDGKGVTLMTDPALATSQCSVIFITAASDMETCSQAIRNGAFDYILNCFSVDEVVSAAGLSKTTARRYLEHGVETGFLEVEMLYGKIGHPRRLYRRAKVKS